jgi:uncharacterized protein (DUF2062 family)
MLKRITPTAESLRRSRWLSWLGPRVHEPHFWRLNRRRVARGVAIGAFFAVLLPVAQIPAAILVAFLLRAHLLAAVLTTFISNPLTLGPIYYAAYQLGMLILGSADSAANAATAASAVPVTGGWLSSLSSTAISMGQPLLVGTLLLAAAAGTIAYLTTDLVWRMRVIARWRKRSTRCPRSGTVGEVNP